MRRLRVSRAATGPRSRRGFFRLSLCWTSAVWLGCVPAAEPPEGISLPVRFVAERIFLDLPVPGQSDTLSLYTDTGGGLFLLGSAADRVGIDDPAGVRLSALQSGLPDPKGEPNGLVPVLRAANEPQADFDGMLGQSWFADRVWRFDYHRSTLTVFPAGLPTRSLGRRTPIWFKEDSAGARVLSFPRIQIEVDGEVLDMLLDTGATGNLTDRAASVLADRMPILRATSFITSGVLDRWSQRHPDWRVIEDADRTVSAMAMIEVPAVTIAGETVGPVWFTERPDRNFHEYMAQWMDRPVEGAVGGNLFRFFALTVDYPGSAAYFDRASR